MGKINSRNKGSAGEREVIGIIHDLLGIKLERNLAQTRCGGFDLLGLEPWAVEVKRAKKPLLNQWWQQTIEQAGAAGLKPVLWYRLDNQKWRVVLPLAEIHSDFGTSLGLEYTAELSPEGFALVWRELRLPDTQ